jgi:cytidyltransferase-like protein
MNIATGGYFIWLHAGHIEYLKKAKELGSVTVILNNDLQQKLKYGRVIVPYAGRKAVLEGLKYVDRVVMSIDRDRTVIATLDALRPDAFAKGGDRNKDEIPERIICDKLNIKIIDGLGQKIQSSSQLLRRL